MSVAQVGWQLADGIRALRSLLTMLEEAAAGCKVSVKKASSWESMGLQIDKKYWVGVAFDDPNRLRFQTEGCPIDADAARSLEMGSVIQKDWAPGGLIWRHVADLNSEEIFFFARSKARQMQWLESFLRESLDMARRIEQRAASA